MHQIQKEMQPDYLIRYSFSQAAPQRSPGADTIYVQLASLALLIKQTHPYLNELSPANESP